MTCPCSLKAKPNTNTNTQFVVGGDGGNGGLVALSEFKSEGQVKTTNTLNSFVDLAYSVPFLASAADAYITDLLSKQFIIGFEPTFFQIPYIYSYADNLINGNYTISSLKDEGDLTITTYKIPYQGEFKEEIVTIITYFNKQTNILFHEIPREFSYNSVEQASVSYSQVADGRFSGVYSIPYSFVTNITPPNSTFFIDFNITPNTGTISNITTTLDSSLIKATNSLRQF
jgi:hypothetical protein